MEIAGRTVKINNTEEVTTILGPAGVSHWSEAKRPPKTAIIPTIAERKALWKVCYL